MQSIRIICIMQGRRGARGLALIELVTAATAVAVLASVTLLSLGGVRNASQREVCLNNLRRIAAASADYSADDPRDNAIPVHPYYDAFGQTVIGDYQYGGKSGNVDHAAQYIYTAEGAFGSLTRPLNPYLYDLAGMIPPECRDIYNPTPDCIALDKSLPLDAYRCPSDSGKTGLHYTAWGASGRSAYDFFGTSYNCSQGMICDGANGPMFSVTPFQRPRSDVPNPARTMLYMETCGRFAWAWGFGPWGFGTGFTVGGWHGEDWMFNMAFVDGHAATIRVQGSGATGIVNSKDDVEYIPGLPGRMDNWWQVITRGRDWQYDCLPAQAIPVNKRCGGGIGTDVPAGPQPMTLAPSGLD